jgi:hypothetical protein
MKGVFGLVGLLLALVIVGVVVKKQLDSTSQRVPALAPAVPGGVASEPATTVREQSQQVQQQYKQAVDGLMQQPRPMQDEK